MVGRTVDPLRHRQRTEVEQQADGKVAEPQVGRKLTLVDGAMASIALTSTSTARLMTASATYAVLIRTSL
jgi:hypothetical protein